jgi:uncharacterized protein YggT (Ycf19 family)
MFVIRLLLAIINTALSFIEILIGVRILFVFFGANRQAPFVQWLYAASNPLLAPFRNIFPSPNLNHEFIIEVPSIIALIIYAFAGYLLVELLNDIENRTRR